MKKTHEPERPEYFDQIGSRFGGDNMVQYRLSSLLFPTEKTPSQISVIFMKEFRDNVIKDTKEISRGKYHPKNSVYFSLLTKCESKKTQGKTHQRHCFLSRH